MTTFLDFKDHLIPYEQFVEDVSARVARYIRNDDNDPEYVSLRKANTIFGRRNIERWRKLNLIIPIPQKGKLLFKTADLRLLQRTGQNLSNKRKSS